VLDALRPPIRRDDSRQQSRIRQTPSSIHTSCPSCIPYHYPLTAS
jgi:hypothetical protein